MLVGHLCGRRKWSIFDQRSVDFRAKTIPCTNILCLRCLTFLGVDLGGELTLLAYKAGVFPVFGVDDLDDLEFLGVDLERLRVLDLSRDLDRPVVAPLASVLFMRPRGVLAEGVFKEEWSRANLDFFFRGDLIGTSSPRFLRMLAGAAGVSLLEDF